MSRSIIALDVGEVRIGVALANTIARLASPQQHIQNTPEVADDIVKLIEQHEAEALVVGLPRGMDGQETAQTKSIQEFVKKLQQTVAVPIHFQDESLTSLKAEEELAQRGRPYQKGDIDSLAACYILTDFLERHPKVAA